MKYGFIGCGNMGGALARALSKTTKDIILSDFIPEKAKELAAELGCDFGSNEEIAKKCDRIFLGVKPQVMRETLAEISGILKGSKPLLITMAAGLKINAITDYVGETLPVIRIMPNTPVSVGEGMILYCRNDLVSDKDLQSFVEDMKHSGTLDLIDEELIDAGCSVSGCGPAFMFMFADAIAKAGTACGLTREKAIKYAATTMLGSAKLLLSSDKTPDELKQAVCSKGGSTIMGVNTFEEGGLYELAQKAVDASYKRNIELGKQ